MSRGGPGPVPTDVPGMVLVTMRCGMSASELGDFRVIPDVIPDGIHAHPGDTVEVDAETADRWVEAGIAEVRSAAPP